MIGNKQYKKILNNVLYKCIRKGHALNVTKRFTRDSFVLTRLALISNGQFFSMGISACILYLTSSMCQRI